jgi:hypothetical protein
MTKDEAARLMSMKPDSIADVYDVADGVLVVTSEGAQTLIVDGRCSAVYPRRDLPAAEPEVAEAEPAETPTDPEPVEVVPAKKTTGRRG